MNIWDKLCERLRAGKVSVEDVSNKVKPTPMRTCKYLTSLHFCRCISIIDNGIMAWRRWFPATHPPLLLCHQAPLYRQNYHE